MALNALKYNHLASLGLKGLSDTVQYVVNEMIVIMYKCCRTLVCRDEGPS